LRSTSPPPRAATAFPPRAPAARMSCGPACKSCSPRTAARDCFRWTSHPGWRSRERSAIAGISQRPAREEPDMRAVVTHETGGPEVLRLEDVSDPEPSDGEILVRVRAAAVNPIDWKIRRGLVPRTLPAILGSDAAGTVVRSLAE